MAPAPRLQVALAALVLAGCADLLGVEPLSGTDAATPAGDGGCEIDWIEAHSGIVPPGAAPNPVPGSSADLYVCRVPSPTLGLVPGKLLPGYFCYYGDGERELHSPDYEVLVPHRCTLAWAPAPRGVTPIDAVATGDDLDGGLLYSCRVGTMAADPGELGHVGWSTSHACVYSLSDASLTATDFDILTAK